MKKYEAPKVEVVDLAIADVVTASITGGGNDENVGGGGLDFD